MKKNEHPVKVCSTGGYYGEPSSQETPNLQSSLFEYADGKVLEFATRGGYTNDEGTQKIGNLFYGTKGWLWIDGEGRTWQSYLGRKSEKGPGAEAGAATGDGAGPAQGAPPRACPSRAASRQLAPLAATTRLRRVRVGLARPGRGVESER